MRWQWILQHLMRLYNISAVFNVRLQHWFFVWRCPINKMPKRSGSWKIWCRRPVKLVRFKTLRHFIWIRCGLCYFMHILGILQRMDHPQPGIGYMWYDFFVTAPWKMHNILLGLLQFVYRTLLSCGPSFWDYKLSGSIVSPFFTVKKMFTRNLAETMRFEE